MERRPGRLKPRGSHSEMPPGFRFASTRVAGGLEPEGMDRETTWIRNRAAGIACAVLATLVWAFAAPAADASPEELKARFVFQLLKYVTWPEASAPASAPFVVGVVGNPAFATALGQVIGTDQAQGRAVEVRQLGAAGESAGVHLLYLPKSEASEMRQIARDHHGVPVLTVADRFDFPELGGDVGIELVGGRVSFSINRRKTVRGDLVISSKLMRLASEVK